MKITLFAMFIFSVFHVPKAQSQNSIHSLSVTSIDGELIPLSYFKGKKLMIVNTASDCGFTPQYKDLEKLYQQYKEKGFEILAFPSNDFNNQEKGSNSDIKVFCERNYGVTFKLTEKINVRSNPIHPVYQWLTKKELNGLKNNKVKWNFHKFLIDEEGRLMDDLNPWRSPNCYKIRKWLRN